ncbi:MAG: hypothetical protein AUK16_02945 [Parcubacteria group bacterium CG2_30_44_11]|nr:MAG: hypothetical protein AUK16_02945 [Parcubacteria group bacterium CG2_30_44_11]
MDLYHALNRGVDKRIIFMDDQDRARFVHDMFEFNDARPAKNVFRKHIQMSDFVNRSFPTSKLDNDTPLQPRQKLVDIHGWCLMENHYHLLLSERVDSGLIKFLRKLNVGYANYFNKRYDRTGTLFQGRTKKIHINNDAYFLHILNYIHLNPLDFQESTAAWRQKTINDVESALEFLNQYRWSSYLDYNNTKNFPSILTTSLFQDVFDNHYAAQLANYLRDIDTSSNKSLYLE